MKALFLKIKLFFIKLFYAKKLKTEARIEEKLKVAIAEKNLGKELIKLKILRYIKKEYGRKSKFFCKRWKSNAAIKKEIDTKFAEEIKEFNLVITQELKFK